MAERRIKEPIGSGGNRNPAGILMKEKIMSMKYDMETPAGPIFAYDDDIPDKTYPDFSPWKDDIHLKEKLNNLNFLNKGYFEGPQVPNEYYSARNLIQETIFSSPKNCPAILKELSQHLTKSYEVRNEVINKIRASSSNFRIPPRVTLTAQKKEAWLRDLANPEVPLANVASKIPHGIRNKVLVDAMCTKRVPLSRAIWFTKCSLLSELILLQKKLKSKLSSHNGQGQGQGLPPHLLGELESRLVQEWTQQVTDHVFKLTKDLHTVTSNDAKVRYQSKLNYLISYILTLYIEDLIDKVFFLSLIIKCLRELLPFKQTHLPLLIDLSRSDPDEEETVLAELLDGKALNPGQILIPLTIIRVFWKDILEEVSLAKTLCESLLLSFLLIERCPTEPKPNFAGFIPEGIKSEFLCLLSSHIIEIFYHNTNCFIIPDYWPAISGILLRILDDDASRESSDHNKRELSRTFSLLNLRNESLMLNLKHQHISGSEMKEEASAAVSGSTEAGTKSLVIDQTSISRSEHDVLKLIEQLDRFRLKQVFEPIFARVPTVKIPPHERYLRLRFVILWCISSHRDMGASKERLLMVCNYIKQKLLKITGKGASRLKAEIETDILEAVFSMAEYPELAISLPNLYALINELYQLKVITISAYLRKVIASGIFYHPLESEDAASDDIAQYQMSFHLLIVKNLPVLNNKQSEHILRKWDSFLGLKNNAVESNPHSMNTFHEAIEVLQKEFLDKLLRNDPNSITDENLSFLSSLSVGIRFLVANWATSEIKDSISRSSRLVHLTPLVITKVYKFYELTDNLTVFFKAFIKFVLKNENKVIIFYLDTLYFVARLVMKHYNLIKSIAGASSDSVPTAFELFKLLVVNYKDLLSRETNILPFTKVWEFIEHCLEKRSTSSKTNAPTAPHLPFDKELADTPMKVQLSFLPLLQTDNYTLDMLKLDLQLVKGKQGELTQEDKQDLIQELREANIPQVSGLGVDQIFDSSNDLIYWRALFETFLIGDEKGEIILTRLIRMIPTALQKTTNAIKDIFPILASLEKQLTILCKLVASDLCDFCGCLTALDHLGDTTGEDDCQRLRVLLLFGVEEASACLFDYQTLMFAYAKDEFFMNNRSYSLEQSIKFLKMWYSSQPDQPIGISILNVIRECLIQNTPKTIHEVISHVEPDKLGRLANEIYKTGATEATVSDIGDLTGQMDEFNLPFMQFLVCVATKDLGIHGKAATHEVVKTVLRNLRSVEKGSVTYFGEIFSYVTTDIKMRVFHTMEEIFLENTHFVGSEAALVLDSRDNQANLVGAFEEYFKKFCVSSTANIETTQELFRKLMEFSQSLVTAIVAPKPHESTTVSDVISIFLRLLIIHNYTLVSLIIQFDHAGLELLKRLVQLFNSRYIAEGPEKLQIVLFDLLNLFKNSLIQRLSVRGRDDVLAASPANIADQQPTPVEDTKDTESQSTVGRSLPAHVLMAQISELLDLQEPKRMRDTGAMKHATAVAAATDNCMVLDEQELTRDADVTAFNNKSLSMRPSKSEPMSLEGTFGGPSRNNDLDRQFCIKSYRLIEDVGRGINDGCVNLSMFEAYTTKENPP